MRTLNYHRKILADILEDDSLLVMAKGLGLTKVLGMFLSMYCSPQFLVIVVSSDEKFLDLLQDELSGLNCALPIRKVTSEKNADDRGKLYGQGGVIAITHRILVVDLLNGILDTSKVTGMVVPDAHRVLDTTNESFVLRIYRQKNKKGFIKGFSDCPETFQIGFSRTEKVPFLSPTQLFPCSAFPGYAMLVCEKAASLASISCGRQCRVGCACS